MANEKCKSLSRAPGITYNVAKCKGGYGVYVCALSGQPLADLCGMFPGMSIDVDETSPTYAQILFQGEPIDGAMRVNSNRLAYAKSYAEGLKIVNRLKEQTERKQLDRLMRVRMWLVNKDKVLVKGKYYQFHRDVLGNMVKVTTSQNRDKLAALADSYITDGTPAKIVPTVTRTKVLHPSQTVEYWDADRKKIIEPITASMDTSPYPAKGIKGMCNPKRGPEAIQRISQKRKRTTTVNFHSKYR